MLSSLALATLLTAAPAPSVLASLVRTQSQPIEIIKGKPHAVPPKQASSTEAPMTQKEREAKLDAITQQLDARAKELDSREAADQTQKQQDDDKKAQDNQARQQQAQKVQNESEQMQNAWRHAANQLAGSP